MLPLTSTRLFRSHKWHSWIYFILFRSSSENPKDWLCVEIPSRPAQLAPTTLSQSKSCKFYSCSILTLGLNFSKSSPPHQGVWMYWAALVWLADYPFVSARTEEVELIQLKMHVHALRATRFTIKLLPPQYGEHLQSLRALLICRNGIHRQKIVPTSRKDLKINLALHWAVKEGRLWLESKLVLTPHHVDKLYLITERKKNWHH